jgi:hypothetical protein
VRNGIFNCVHSATRARRKQSHNKIDALAPDLLAAV